MADSRSRPTLAFLYLDYLCVSIFLKLIGGESITTYTIEILQGLLNDAALHTLLHTLLSNIYLLFTLKFQ